MTQRERQILELIAHNPMISQAELADTLGIARSSAAVHISNLIKKGHIVGKGYVLRSGSYAVVVGGANVDIGGRSRGALVAGDSNPGKVGLSIGGVGRNIAHNLSLLGADVRMLTAYGDDLYGQGLVDACTAAGIDMSQALKLRDEATSTYLYIAGQDGDMALAVSDMAICDRIDPEYLASHFALLQNAQVIVCDTNIPSESLEYLTKHFNPPIFCDPVSTTKAEKLRPILGKLHTLKPNKMEAELLSGVPIREKADVEKAAQALLDAGLHLPGRRRHVCRDPGGILLAGESALSDGQHHRLRRQLHGCPGLGIPGGSEPSRECPRRPGCGIHHHRVPGDHQPRNVRGAAAPKNGAP